MEIGQLIEAGGTIAFAGLVYLELRQFRKAFADVATGMAQIREELVRLSGKIEIQQHVTPVHGVPVNPAFQKPPGGPNG